MIKEKIEKDVKAIWNKPTTHSFLRELIVEYVLSEIEQSKKEIIEKFRSELPTGMFDSTPYLKDFCDKLDSETDKDKLI